jgi:hypothetical protein
MFASALFHQADGRRLDGGNQSLVQRLGVAWLVLPVLEKIETSSGPPEFFPPRNDARFTAHLRDGLVVAGVSDYCSG